VTVLHIITHKQKVVASQHRKEKNPVSVALSQLCDTYRCSSHLCLFWSGARSELAPSVMHSSPKPYIFQNTRLYHAGFFTGAKLHYCDASVRITKLWTTLLCIPTGSVTYKLDRNHDCTIMPLFTVSDITYRQYNNDERQRRRKTSNVADVNRSVAVSALDCNMTLL